MRFSVEGMTCDHCVRAITRAIERLGGSARVDLAGRGVEIDGPVDAAAARRAIEEEGYVVVSDDPGATAR